MSWRHFLRKNKILAIFSSVKLTTGCLFLLFVLTFWGTVAQVENGLYSAQERYFHSFYFLAAGFIPFAGAQLVMWVLFINLLAVALVRFVYEWRRAGILIIHAGLLLFLVSGYVTLRCSVESYMSLEEGQSKNVSQSAHQWELALWPRQDDGARQVAAVDARAFAGGKQVDFSDFGFVLTADEYYPNADALGGLNENKKFINASGIIQLRPKGLSGELEKNIPGGIFTISSKTGVLSQVLLYGLEDKPAVFYAGGRPYEMKLRLKQYPLPIVIKLVDFIKEDHPGTDIPRSFKSVVNVGSAGAWRQKTISMNDPLRHKDYTFYQSSYEKQPDGREVSVLSVVRNPWRILPYWATFVTFFGLVFHFILMAVNTIKRPDQPG